MMRRSLSVVLLLIVLLLAAGLAVIYLKSRRPVPTQFNWPGHVLTIAGDGAPGFLEAKQPLEARFSDPFGVASGSDGAIYVSDAGDSNRIMKLTPEGNLVTLAGGAEGFADGAQSSFNTPSGLAADTDGNLYVADTGNNRIRKISPEGIVSTVAGSGVAGYRDGPASSAEFNGPIGVAVDSQRNIYVADTYNDRIRKITPDGYVSTLAGAGGPGDADGDTTAARFDTPCALVITPDGSVVVADTGNNKLRKITANGRVSTLQPTFVDDPNREWLRTPMGLAITHDGFLYVTEQGRGVILEIAPDGKACSLAGKASGFADGFAADARFNRPSGIAVEPRSGDVVIADSANYLIRRLAHGSSAPPAPTQVSILPRLDRETLSEQNMLWPLDPQDRAHEVVATMGEVRGSFDSTDSRDHLHSGLDVAGAYGDTVRAVRTEKVTAANPNWSFGELSEGLRVGVISYIHIHVGRDKEGNVFNDPRFIPVMDEEGKTNRIRVRRGTRFRQGDAVGTVNRMYHVHLIVGPSGAELNPLLLAPIGFTDTTKPTIEKNGIQLFDEVGQRLKEMDHGRLVVSGRVSIVVDAFDRSNMNGERRRLGLYSLGYQLLKDSSSQNNNNHGGEPVEGFSTPLKTIVFDHLPPDENATKLAYAPESGITVYGSKTTRFLYQVTNTVRDGHVRAGTLDTALLPKGEYVLRISAADYSGNEASENRDLLITIK